MYGWGFGRAHKMLHITHSRPKMINDSIPSYFVDALSQSRASTNQLYIQVSMKIENTER
jgi:hypothetical protein